MALNVFFKLEKYRWNRSFNIFLKLIYLWRPTIKSFYFKIPVPWVSSSPLTAILIFTLELSGPYKKNIFQQSGCMLLLIWSWDNLWPDTWSDARCPDSPSGAEVLAHQQQILIATSSGTLCGHPQVEAPLIDRSSWFKVVITWKKWSVLRIDDIQVNHLIFTMPLGDCDCISIYR